MASTLRTLLMAIIVFITPIQLVTAADYHLAPGDILSIGVWGYEELQLKQVIVRPDGKVSFPLVGEMKVEGISTGDFTEGLMKKLSVYIKNPQVTVNVDKFHTTRIYVLGQVSKPGMYEIERQHNLLDAISMAGGYTKEAAKKKVMVLRKAEPGKVQTANLINLLNKADLTQNYPLADGDIVFLKDNGRIDFARDIMPFVSGLYYVDNMKND
ncbi:polysaccharide biosynthesis/export family protein [Sporomusa sp. KB1]|uniref:polysaccharide biosynthesis/export family protein n=1 Tax=Sporomusa sp. KB1 TaxID=943346 RepID=UPI0011ABBD1A|nr:polysaccharide biosynthesis/export family protein [Sporomusa sp. KB1]TWH45296.1 polysaccharide export outer membrane protein [Sporomusa sp. KB1]